MVVDNRVDGTDTRFIAHGTISVYVKEVETGTWHEYSEVDNLFLSSGKTKVYDIRLNENGHYEIKFGNDTFGRKLQSGDQVAVYYILSDNEKGIIGKNAINGNKLFNFNSNQFNQIYSTVNTVTNSTLINLTNNGLLTFSNTTNSTPIADGETVDQIRQNAPFLISSQLRLVTESDYEKFLLKSIPNILNSVKVVDNTRFINEYIEYFYSICVDPNKSNRVILNQVNFADSCDFNNVNVFCVPKFNIVKDEEYPQFLSNSFKNLIVDLTSDKKIISQEIIPRDPIYVAFDIGYSNQQPSKDVYATTKLEIFRDSTSKVNKETLKRKVLVSILNFFSSTNNTLGQKMDLSVLANNILTLEGVKRLRTRNGEQIYNGLSFIAWNPIYENVDEQFVTQTITLPYFKFPYFYRPETLINRIDILDE